MQHDFWGLETAVAGLAFAKNANEKRLNGEENAYEFL